MKLTLDLSDSEFSYVRYLLKREIEFLTLTKLVLTEETDKLSRLSLDMGIATFEKTLCQIMNNKRRHVNEK